MDTDDIAPPPKTAKPVNLDTLSIFELEAHIAKLEAEKEAAKAMITKKKNALSVASSVFKT